MVTPAVNTRLVIDGVMILTLIFYGGVGWQKLDGLQRQIDAMSISQLRSSDNLNGERLARVETKLDAILTRLDKVESALRSK